MRLKKLKLKNFRGYKELELELDRNLNVIVGRNDVGKSTILEALEIFFNSESVKIEEEDWNVQCLDENEKTMSISCAFELIKDEILIDSANKTSCKSEFLLNKENLLEIKKEWINNKAGTPKIYIVANYISYYKDNPLPTRTHSQLKKEYDLVKSEVTYTPRNMTISAEIRKAIYSSKIQSDKEQVDIEVARNFKDMGNKIMNQLPFFYLFQSDRSNTDKDDEIQSPLKVITNKVLNEMNDEIRELEEKVKEEISKVGIKTIEMLEEIGGKNVAEDIKPSVTMKSMNNLFVFDLISEDSIPLNKRGSGIRRLVLLSYFRAEAEKEVDTTRNIIYAIEEPETSQHPDFQTMIMDSLIKISEKETHQIIITTHTPEFAKVVKLDELIFIKKENGKPIIVEENNIKIKNIKKSLGILPNINYSLVICVEGKFDVHFLKNINKYIPELKEIIDLKEEDIPIIPLRGSSLIEYIEKDYFKESNVKEVHIYDGDVEEYVNKIKEINDDEETRRVGVTTKLLEMENYIHRDIIIKEFKDIEINKSKDEYKTMNIPKYISGKYLDSPKYGQELREKELAIKGILNKRLSKKITKGSLEDLGVWEEVKSWFELISSKYES